MISRNFGKDGVTSDWTGRLLFGEASGGLEYAISFPGIYPIYRSVREGRYKLVERELGTETDYELFDLTEDPDEQINLVAKKPAILARMRGHLEERSQKEVRSPAGTVVELDAAEKEELRALGMCPE